MSKTAISVLVVCTMGLYLLLTTCTEPGNKTSSNSADTIASRDTVRNIATAEFQDSISPEQVLEKFRAGNKRFLDGAF